MRRADVLSGLGLAAPVRSFVALPCPERLRRTLAEAVAGWRGIDADVSWTNPASSHLTLRFLGTADPPRLERLHALLPGAAGAVREVRAAPGAPGAFPGWSRARVLWLGIESGGAIERLAAAVEEAARAAGFEPEDRRFTAHLTLGRVRGPRGTKRALEAVRRWAPAGAPERVPEIVLYASELGPGGSRHLPLARYAIG